MIISYCIWFMGAFVITVNVRTLLNLSWRKSILVTLIGLFFVLTAIIGWCPISRLLGISTCKYDEEVPADTTDQHTDRHVKNRLFK